MLPVDDCGICNTLEDRSLTTGCHEQAVLISSTLLIALRRSQSERILVPEAIQSTLWLPGILNAGNAKTARDIKQG